MMNMAGAELRKANSRRDFLHPFKSFSTSRVQWRVEPSPERADKGKKEAGGSGAGGGFLAQLRRSFTLGHRSSSASANSANSVSSASAAAAESSKYKRSNSGAWGRRMKQGLSKPLKAVTESYVGCMMGIAEDSRVESLQGMGFRNPTGAEDAFKTSASRRYDRSSSCPPHILRTQDTN